MKLIVNGEELEYTAMPLLGDFLAWWLKENIKVVTVVNDEIISESQRKNYQLKEKDKIEILTFAGGG